MLPNSIGSLSAAMASIVGIPPFPGMLDPGINVWSDNGYRSFHFLTEEGREFSLGARHIEFAFGKLWANAGLGVERICLSASCGNYNAQLELGIQLAAPLNLFTLAIVGGVKLNSGNGQALNAERQSAGAAGTPKDLLSGYPSGLGTTIRNVHLAGKVHPKTGIPFDENGFPDFSGVAVRTVNIQQTGKYQVDNAAANRAAGLDVAARGFTWHHHQNGTTMQLVPTDIHRATGHTGGVATTK